MKSVQVSIIYCFVSIVSNVNAFTSFTCKHNSRPTLLYSTAEDTVTAASEATDAAVTEPRNNNRPSFANNQPKYGNELALPETYVRCGRCATSFALTPEDLGDGKGRRVECSVCSHNWFQSRDRLFSINEGRELVPLPQVELNRIASNLANGRDPDYVGDTKFFVGNLDFAVEEDDIREIFATIGEVGDVSLVTGPDGRSKGFAFVTMMDEEVLEKCLGLDGTELKGRAVNVKLPN